MLLRLAFLCPSFGDLSIPRGGAEANGCFTPQRFCGGGGEGTKRSRPGFFFDKNVTKRGAYRQRLTRRLQSMLICVLMDFCGHGPVRDGFLQFLERAQSVCRLVPTYNTYLERAGQGGSVVVPKDSQP